jgi:hypothetical protein
MSLLSRIMIVRLFAFLLAALTLPLQAELGGPSNYDGFFYLDFYRSSPNNRRVTVEYDGETMADNVLIPSTGFHVETFFGP